MILTKSKKKISELELSNRELHLKLEKYKKAIGEKNQELVKLKEELNEWVEESKRNLAQLEMEKKNVEEKQKEMSQIQKSNQSLQALITEKEEENSSLAYDLSRCKVLAEEKWGEWQIFGPWSKDGENYFYTFRTKYVGDESFYEKVLPDTVNFFALTKTEVDNETVWEYVIDEKTKKEVKIPLELSEYVRDLTKQGKFPHKHSKIMELKTDKETPNNLSESLSKKILNFVGDKKGREIDIKEIAEGMRVDKKKLYMPIKRLEKRMACKRIGRGVYIFNDF